MSVTLRLVCEVACDHPGCAAAGRRDYPLGQPAAAIRALFAAAMLREGWTFRGPWGGGPLGNFCPAHRPARAGDGKARAAR